MLCLTACAQSFATLTRLTNTPEHALNLNPTISDDGRTVVFESSADLESFRVLRSDLSSFAEIGRTRAVCPAISVDGGRNADRNSEIYLFDGVKLNQFTHETNDVVPIGRQRADQRFADESMRTTHEYFHCPNILRWGI